MILPRGVTGFWSVNAAPLPLLDEKAFCQMCYSIALENGGTVTELDTDTYPRNFYSVKLSRHDQSVFVLQNIHYPYAAFAQRDASGRFVLTQQPEWLQLPGAEPGRAGADPLLGPADGGGDRIQYLGLKLK